MIRASLLLWLAAPAAWCEPALTFDAATQSVRATNIAPELLTAFAEKQPQWSALIPVFAVYFGDASTPMLGDYLIDGEGLRFTPRFPFLPHRDHRAVFDPGALSAILGLPRPPGERVLRLSFRVDAPEPSSATRVNAVYPSGEVVPANLLRIYIVFSQSMSRRDIEQHIQLLGEGGRPVEHPFLDIEEGLWDPEAQRLTLVLNPGRIKRGLKLNQTMGPPLKAGGRYRLVVSADAKDAAGRPLAQAFSKEYRVAAAERSRPDPRRWRLTVPQGTTRELLVVTADRPLDQALFERLVRVEDQAGSPLGGQVAVENGGTVWRFTPTEPWRQGGYRLRVAAQLEDLAGNRPTRLFDELADASGLRREAREMLVPFQVRN